MAADSPVAQDREIGIRPDRCGAQDVAAKK